MSPATTELPGALGRVSALVPEGRRDAASVRDGYLDLLGPKSPGSSGPVQRVMLSSALPMVYERWWRPAWGRVARGWRGPSMEGEHKIAARLLELHAGDAVLDLACGTGNFTRRFARAVGPEGLVVGVDVSETMLSRAVTDTRDAGLTGHVAYVRGDAAALPLIDGTVDAACCFAGLNLMTEPHAALAEMARVLAPGGRIALFTSARFRTPGLRLSQTLATRQSGMTIFERDELTGALDRLGFTDIRQLTTGTTQFVGGARPSA